MATLTIRYDVRDESEEVAKLLCIPKEIRYLNLEVEYHVTKAFSGNYYEPAEPAEVEFETDPVVCSIETDTGSFIPTEKQSRTLWYDVIDTMRLEEACYADHEKELDDWIVDKADRILMDREDWGRL